MFNTKFNSNIVLVGLLTLCSCSKLLPDSVLTVMNSGSNPLNINDKLTATNKFSKSGTLSLSFPILAENYSLNDAPKGEKGTNKKIFLAPNNPLVQSEMTGSSPFSAPAVLDTETSSKPVQGKRYAPLLGFIPVHASFQPADNEVWMELERDSSTIRIFKGKEKLKEVVGKGKISLAPGEYPLQHKQKSPLWYAPDEYFEKRQLKVPPRGDHFRYRRGALGNYAIYPTMDFIIHSGPFMSEEIGGLKVSEGDLSSIFSLININAPIIVK